MRCLDAVPAVRGVISTLSCSVATVSLSVLAVQDRVMQANLAFRVLDTFSFTFFECSDPLLSLRGDKQLPTLASHVKGILSQSQIACLLVKVMY